MRYPFTFTIDDEILGIRVALDIECDIEVTSVSASDYVITGVYKDGANLFRGQAITKAIATEALDRFDEQWKRDSAFRDDVYARFYSHSSPAAEHAEARAEQREWA
jgi:hypothetical protein